MITILEVVVSAGVVATLVTVLSLCVCGCKNSNQKSELVGTAGVVKIRFDEEVPSPSSTTPVSIKRASTQNSQRSLPEIPHPVGRHDSGDTASEIYATVNLDGANKSAVTASTSRDHPYEHAYAKVQNENPNNIIVEVTPDSRSEEVIEIDQREVAESGPESVVISASVAISGQLPSSQELPYITPPSPRPSRETQQHFSGDSTDSTKGYTSISVREPLSNIRAQSHIKQHLQPHYATVSDDSDEMYAAIEEASVGEGSDTYAQIAPEPRRRESTVRANPPDVVPESHVRRSAPPEIGGPSTSKATHSRQASVSSVNLSAGALGSPKPEKRQANSPLPPPPAPPLQQPVRPAAVAEACRQQHQRISSTGDLFSNEKLRRSLNEKHQRNNSCVSSSDFYGCNYPVEKHRFSSGDLMRPLVAKELNFDIDNRENPQDNLYNSIDAYSDYSSADANISMNSEQRVTESPSKNIDEMYAKVMKKTKAKEDARKSNDFSNHDGEAHTSKFRGDDPGYETIDRKKSANHGYETIEHKERKNVNQDPGYETVKDVNKKSSAIYANNDLLNKLNNLTDSGPNSIISSDPGYEHIAKPPPSDSDPNYEVLRNQPPTPPYATISPNYKIQPTYSTVHKRPGKYNDWNSNDATVEPNYESMPHEPLYTTGSESDPNYESVRPKDPNYESVSSHEPNYESLRPKDPKYESLRSKDPKYDSVRSKKDPNYESVKYFEVGKKDPPYEKVNNDGPEMSVERSDSMAGYEKINVPQENSNASIIKSTDDVVSDYFQV